MARDRGGLGALSTANMRRPSQVDRGLGDASPMKGTEPVYGAHDLVERYQDQEDVPRQAKLLRENLGFKNLAGNKEVAEQAKYAVLESLNETFSVMEYLRNKWLILYRLYRGESLAMDFSFGRVRLHSPEPFKIVETIHPRLMRTIYGTNRWFKIYAENREHDPNSECQEALCRDQFRRMNFYSTASRFLRSGLIYGTAIQKLWWKQDVRRRAFRRGRRVPHPDIPGATRVELEEVKRKELVFDGNVIDTVEIFDFLTSPLASDIDEAEWCADRSRWPVHKVRTMGRMGLWKNLDELKDHPGSVDGDIADDHFKQVKNYSVGVFDPREASGASHIPHYKVIDWWGPLDIPTEDGGWETRECNVVMIEPESRQTIALIMENPFWHGKKPYQAWRPIDLDKEFYGVGAIEMIARLSREKDMKRNLGMAASQLEANPMFLAADDANIPQGQFVVQPGLTIRVPDPSRSVMPLHVPRTSDSALKAESILTMDIRETAGTTSPSMGASDPFGSGSGKTASQHNAEIDMANLRVSDMIGNYDAQVVTPMLEAMTWNNQQFQTIDKVIRDVGAIGIKFQDRLTIRPQDLIGRFIARSLASFRLLTKQTMVQQLTNLLDRVPIFAQLYGPTSIKGPKLMAYILEHGFDILNAEEFIAVPPDESGLLTALEEHEAWYHGEVPPRHADDNDLRHVQNHLAELQTERFAFLDEKDPATTARVRAHIAEHMKKLALLKEQQEKLIMQAQQAATMMNIQPPPMHGAGLPQDMAIQGPNGESPIAGAGGPNQQPGSPNVRRGEMARGENNNLDNPQSEAMGRAPNPGAS